jgi:hypothetical protein
MTKKEKQIESLRRNLSAVRFDDACKIAERLGFARQGGKGSQRTYGRIDEPFLLNFQNRDGYILAYQAKQLLEMVNKYATVSD